MERNYPKECNPVVEDGGEDQSAKKLPKMFDHRCLDSPATAPKVLALPICIQYWLDPKCRVSSRSTITGKTGSCPQRAKQKQ